MLHRQGEMVLEVLIYHLINLEFTMFNLFPPGNDLYEMELIGDHQTMVGIPVDSPEELKRRIFAAIKSYHLRLASVDYTLKHYGTNWRFPHPDQEQEFLLNTLRTIERRVQYIINLLTSGEQRPEIMGLLAAEAALIRLNATFRSASILIMQGYPFEAASMCRIILEQLAWAYAVSQLTDKEAIIKLKPPRSITKFKELLPTAGRLYGVLSSQAHLDPEDHRHYIMIEEGGAIVVRYYLPHDTKLILASLLVLLNAFYQTTKAISGTYIQEALEEGHDFIPKYKTDPQFLEEALEQLQAELNP
jgi:hypothetical protein